MFDKKTGINEGGNSASLTVNEGFLHFFECARDTVPRQSALWYQAPTLCVWLEWGLGGGWGLEGVGA